jgi:MFS family permease
MGCSNPERDLDFDHAGHDERGGFVRGASHSRCVHPPTLRPIMNAVKINTQTRLLPGVAVGWYLTFGQLYIYEASPAHLRGVVMVVYQIMLSVGSVVGASVDYGTHTMNSKLAYQIPLTIFFIAPTIQSVAMILFPESPRWLMVQGKEKEAEMALRRLRNSHIDEREFQAEFSEIRESTKEQLRQSRKHLFLEMWRGTNRRRSLLSIAVVCFHSANGSSSLP